MQPTTIKRTFDDVPATRERVPLWLGLYGASGSGKTFSALRLARGIQTVTGGDIFVIDTEARRALAYADRFRFRHVPMAAPFSPLDYLAAIEHCTSKGARIVVIDSGSHEHEGPGGVLEWQASEEERLAKLWNTSRDKAKMAAWQAPKQARRRMINTLLQLTCNFVFCFRAKEKLKVIPGRTPEPQGFMPIAGEEWIYEMTATALLLPGAYGVPTWQSKETGEAAMIKRPEQFRALIEQHAREPLSETMGEAMARWAVGEAAPTEGTRPPPRPRGTSREELAAIAGRIAAADEQALVTLATEAEGMPLGPQQRTYLEQRFAERRKALAPAEAPPAPPTDAEPTYDRQF